MNDPDIVRLRVSLRSFDAANQGVFFSHIGNSECHGRSQRGPFGHIE